jgi:hypothetical protein
MSGVALLLGATACSATAGPLLVRDRPSDAGSDAGPPPLRAAVRADLSLQYQLTGDLALDVDAQLFVIDLFDSSEAQVSALHAAGRVVIAYVSVGSFEPWRDDSSSFPMDSVGMSLAGYPDESWLDVRSASVRSNMQARFDRALSKGFDGIFASTLGGYLQTSGFPLTRADELDYDMFLVDQAHARSLSIGLSGDFELGQTLASDFDWVLAIGCIAENNCSALSVFQAHARPVFDLETDGDQDSVCAQAAKAGIPVTFKHASYDAFRSPCP